MTSHCGGASVSQRIGHGLAAAFLMLPLLVWFAEPATARTFVVNTHADHPPDGCSDNDCTLREALKAANTRDGADVIELGVGTYELKQANDSYYGGALVVRDNLKIVGAGQTLTSVGWDPTKLRDIFVVSDAALTLKSFALDGGDTGVEARDPIDETGADLVIRDMGFHDVREGVFLSSLSVGTLDHVAMSSGITGVYNLGAVEISSSSFKQYQSSALSNGYEASMTVVESVVEENDFVDEFGYSPSAIVNDGDLRIRRSIVRAIKSDILAGIASYRGSLLLADTKILENQATDHAAGVAVRGGEATFHNVTVAGNRADSDGNAIGDGGGIYIDGDSLVFIEESTIKQNLGVRGGGIFIRSGNLWIDKSTLANNKSSANGGGIYGQGTTEIDVEKSTLHHNESAVGGGGIAVTGENINLDLRNSTVSANRAAGYGGGIDSFFGPEVELTNVTVVDNMADSDNFGGGSGGGLQNEDSVAFDVNNSLIAQNAVGTTGGSPDCNGAFDSSGANRIGSNTGCIGFAAEEVIVGSPVVGPLQDNGGPTMTHALLGGSPAIDAGSNCLSTDQRRVPRPGACDAGSYERVKCRGVLVTIVGSGDNESLRGTASADGVMGLGGRDDIAGLDGADGLCGGPDGDVLRGGGGHDKMDGDGGDDTCIGGDGVDEAVECETTESLD